MDLSDNVFSHYVLDDPCVSSRHVLIYTVVYDFDNPLEFPPLVYAHDLSRNGTFWNGQRIDSKNSGAVLLSDGDILRLSATSFLEFRTECQSERSLSPTQKHEAKVVVLKHYTSCADGG